MLDGGCEEVHEGMAAGLPRLDIVMEHIPGTHNPADDFTEPLGWVLHARHARPFMGHCGIIHHSKS